MLGRVIAFLVESDAGQHLAQAGKRAEIGGAGTGIASATWLRFLDTNVDAIVALCRLGGLIVGALGLVVNATYLIAKYRLERSRKQ